MGHGDIDKLNMSSLLKDIGEIDTQNPKYNVLRAIVNIYSKSYRITKEELTNSTWGYKGVRKLFIEQRGTCTGF